MLHNWNELEKLQPRVYQIFKNAIQKNRLAHAYVFEGSKGIGKYACSLLLVKTIMCQNMSDKPCNTCHNCIRIDTGNHPDIIRIQPDGASIKKEQIQLLQREFSYSSFENGKKIYIIEAADKMTTNAANSLLKFLEEPDSDCIAFLLTERANSMLKTILSRCQLIKFSALPVEQMINELGTNFIFGEEAKVLSKLTNDVTAAIEMSEENILGPKLNMVQEFIEKSRTIHVYTLKRQLADAFNGKEGTHLFFQLVLMWYEDMLNFKVNRLEQLIFDSNVVKQESEKYNIATIIRMIQCTQKYQRRIYSNVSFNLLFDGFLADFHGN